MRIIFGTPSNPLSSSNILVTHLSPIPLNLYHNVPQVYLWVLSNLNVTLYLLLLCIWLACCRFYCRVFYDRGRNYLDVIFPKNYAHLFILCLWSLVVFFQHTTCSITQKKSFNEPINPRFCDLSDIYKRE